MARRLLRLGARPHSRLRAPWRAVALLATAAAVAAPVGWWATAQPGAERMVAVVGEPQDHVVTLPFGGRDRHYRLFVPRHLGPGPHALLVALHPLNGSAARFEATSLLDGGAAGADAIVAYPDGVGHSWDAGTCCGTAVRRHVDDVGFLTAVVADVGRHFPIDRHRVGVTGFSNGALMSYRLLCERATVFPVAVAVAGDVVVPGCHPARAVDVLHVHGALDPLIPLGGVARSRLDPAGFPAAAASVERIATADRCSAATIRTGEGTVRWLATGCPGGSRVELVTVGALAHHYPAGTTDSRRYGLDMSAVTWSFLAAMWPA